MAPRLVACPSCSQHIKLDETKCLHCGARLRSDTGMIGRTAGAMLLGLSMTACPGDDSTADTGASNSESNTMGMTGDDSTGGSMSGSASMSGSDATTISPEPEYGVGDTTFGETTETPGSDSTSNGTDDTTSSTGSGTSGDSTTGDSSSSSGFNTGEPEYGVPATDGVPTTGVEPEYGVPEPDYGVPE